MIATSIKEEVSASNMGFFLKKQLATGFVLGSAPRGDNWVSLPYNIPWTAGPGLPPRAKDLCAARFNNSSAVSLMIINASTGVPSSFNCIGVGVNFLLSDEPKGIRIRITNPAPLSINIVGDHDSAKPLPTIYGGFVLPGPKGDNWISLPYHCSWTKAEELCIGLGATVASGMTITRIDAFTGVPTNHFCGLASNNFAFVPGEAIRVRKNSSGNIIGMIPPH